MAYTWTIVGASKKTSGTYLAADGTTLLDWDFYTTNPLPSGGTIRPLEVCLPGGGFLTADQNSLSEEARHFVGYGGFQAVCLSYRAGSAITYDAAVQDVWLGIQNIIALNNADPLWFNGLALPGLLGTSAGGTIALSLLQRHPFMNAATWSSPTDLVDILSQPTNDLPTLTAAINRYAPTAPLKDSASAILHADSTWPPVIVFNSLAELMPYQQADEVESALNALGVPVQKYLLPGSDHAVLYENTIVAETGVEVWKTTVNFALAHMWGPSVQAGSIRSTVTV